MAHEYYTDNDTAAQQGYTDCIDYDIERPDCHIDISRLLLQKGT
jgi:hypothetical protein